MSTRIQRDDLLRHPLRGQIFDIVRREPGIELHKIHARLRAQDAAGGCGFPSIYHHLRLLAHFGLVTSRRAGRYRRFYENGGPQGASATALSILQNRPLPAIGRLLVAHPGVDQSTLWRRFSEHHPCTRQALGYHLRRLEAHALAHGSRRGASKNYYPTDTLQRLLPLAAPGDPSLAAPATAAPD
jgi:predicted transcriptional regulator